MGADKGGKQTSSRFDWRFRLSLILACESAGVGGAGGGMLLGVGIAEGLRSGGGKLGAGVLRPPPPAAPDVPALLGAFLKFPGCCDDMTEESDDGLWESVGDGDPSAPGGGGG